MSDVYMLVEGPFGAWFVIQLPDDVEEEAFKARIEQETGLLASGPVYETTLTALMREVVAGRQNM